MPRLTRKLPAYRRHKARNLAVVTIEGRDIYLGPFGSPESKVAYDREVAAWLARGRRAPVPAAGAGAGPDSLTVNELILRYWEFVRTHYVRDGVPSREPENIKDALRHLRPTHGATAAASFGPSALKTVRRRMIEAGLCRNTINARVGKIRRMFRWAVAWVA